MWRLDGTCKKQNMMQKVQSFNSQCFFTSTSTMADVVMITVFALTPILHVFGHICNINERVERNAQVPVSVSHQSHERNHTVNSLDNELLYSPMSSIRHFIDCGPESWQGKVCLMSQTGTFVISHL